MSSLMIRYHRSILFSAILLLVCQTVKGQPVGNEWINFNQQYFKIPSGEEGLYRISYTNLEQAGFPVSTVDPRRIQLFHRGVECAIHVEGQLDSRFDPTDYILFYGRPNDGTADTELYRRPEAQPHKYYPLYSDTTAYFLTWSTLGAGKRMTFFKENNVGGLPAEPHHLEQVLKLQAQDYSSGLHYPIGVASTETILSTYDYGEGWTGARIGKGSQQDHWLEPLRNPATSGPEPVLELVVAGRNSLRHKFEILVGPTANALRSVKIIEFNSYYTNFSTHTLEWGDIGVDGRMLVRIRVIGVDNADFVSVSYIRMSFAQATNQGVNDQKIYRLLPNPGGKSYIEITNTPVGVQFLYDITDPANLVRIGLNSSASGINAIVPNTTGARTILATRKFIENPKIKKVYFRSMDPARSDYLVVTHRYLRRPTTDYMDAPKAYASYRASPGGGGYDTLLVNISQLYDQFSYGEITPLALYRFARYMYEPGMDKYLFIIGKGLDPSYNFHRSGFDLHEFKDLVPTSGSPGTDVLFSSGLSGEQYVPAIATGRLTAHEAEDVAAYLNKVMEMEATPYNALWRKSIVHLSGGRTPQEQQRFFGYVNYYKSIAVGPYLGAEVATERKQTNNETELLNISEYVNNGLAMITLFGHSSVSANDIEIGKVSNDALGYRNKGKYPCVLVNGCNAGDAYLKVRGFGEDWIYTPDRGALNFIAHTSAGYPSLLNRYSGYFYRNAYADSSNIGKGIGQIVQDVLRMYVEQSFSLSELDISQMEQMALQGDPAVVLFGARQPDYEINADNIYTQSKDGNPISAVTPEFDLAIILRNFGRAGGDSIRVTVNRKLSDGTSIPLDTLVFPAIYHQDTLYFPVRTIGFEGYGNNEFIVIIDPLNEIGELDKTNNTATYQFFIPLGGTSNLYPAPYAIVSESIPRLVAQSLDLLMDQRTYLFELDTSASFGSPVRQSAVINGKVISEWEPDLFKNFQQEDSLVFYWRTKFASPRPEEIDEWSVTSFTFIDNSPAGWSMSHFPQFGDIFGDEIIGDQQERKWKFKTNSTNILVRNFGVDNPDFGYENTTFEVNGQPFIFEGRLCRDNAMNMVAFEKSSAVPYLRMIFNSSTVLDARHCGRVPQVINNFVKSDIETSNRIEQYIDRVPAGDYVLMFSNGEVTYESWPAATRNKLLEIGVSNATIGMLANGYPVILLGKKGAEPNSAIEILPDMASVIPPREQELVLSEDIIGILSEGAMTSPLIGPASSWLSFSQHTSHSTQPISDDYSFDVIGVKASSQEAVLINGVKGASVDLAGIDPKTYPFLKLRMYTSSPDALIPSQLRRWTVVHGAVPEGVLTLADGQQQKGFEKQEGDSLVSRFNFRNISGIAFGDSILVERTVFNKDQRRSYIDSTLIRGLGIGEETDFDVVISTFGKSGLNDLRVFANPYILSEFNYNNNVLELADHFSVISDDINPVLEVTIDGEFIMDGDIVSPSPMIVMRLKDENKILLKSDTTGVDLFLKRPCEGCDFERISLSAPNVVWHPAASGSDFRVEYQPESLADGIYTLKAQAADQSGNISGSEPYSVRFEVINESQITNFFPYPNPFSTSTRFVFTLTGAEIPNEIIIQIMTVAGRVVREITQDEIGAIRIGHNITEYAWDGRDEYGDQLANGVYLYRVKVRMQGQVMDMRATSADKAFKNGVGKMYLLR